MRVEHSLNDLRPANGDEDEMPSRVASRGGSALWQVSPLAVIPAALDDAREPRAATGHPADAFRALLG